MIFIVDEDFSAYEGWTGDLEVRGYRTEALWDAEEAFARLKDANQSEVQLAIIDVMLAGGDPRTSPFTPAMTAGFERTGLCLVEMLARVNPRVFPRRAVYLTNTVNKETLAQLGRAIPDPDGLWRKHRIASPLAFADMVERRIRALDQPVPEVS